MTNQVLVAERIRTIEAIRTGPAQKAALVLIILSLKPATELSLFPWNTAPAETELLLEKAGLCFAKIASKESSKSLATYAVASDKAIVEQMLRPISHRDFGLLMGYPPSAVEAFVRKQRFRGPIPDDVKNALLTFAFSIENCEEEFEHIRRWNRALAQYAPSLLR